MTGRPGDFDDLKRRPFAEIAAGHGYRIDRKGSTRNALLLRADGKPKLVCRCGANGHWVYFSTLDGSDSGTAVDFLLNRGLSFAEIGDLCAPGGGERPGSCFKSQWQAASPQDAPAPLAGRGIGRETLEHYRPLIRGDGRGHAFCGHRDGGRRLTGFEIAPKIGPRRFATGAQRSLFALCADRAGDVRTLVVAESAVDALSLAQLDRRPAGAVYLSTAGTPSARQKRQIVDAIGRLPNLSAVVLAQDADAGGEMQAGALLAAFDERIRAMTERRRPPEGADWNDLLAGQDAQAR